MTLVKVGRQILNNFMASHKGAGKEMTGPLSGRWSFWSTIKEYKQGRSTSNRI